MVRLLQLCRWTFSHKVTVEDFIRLKLICIHKNDKFPFRATLGGVRDNLCTSSIARWKARGRLPIHTN